MEGLKELLRSGDARLILKYLRQHKVSGGFIAAMV